MTLLLLLALPCILLLSFESAGQQSGQQSSISGRVLDSMTGAPLSGARVMRLVDGPPTEPGPRKILQTRTDQDGKFILEGLDPGTFHVGMSRNGYVPQNLTYSLKPGERFDSGDVRFEAKGIIVGRVLDANGSPRVQAQVQPFSYHYLGGVRRLLARPGILTDDRGEFRLSELEPGQYLLNISPSTAHESAPPPPALQATSGMLGAVLYPGVLTLADAEVIGLKSGETLHLKDTVVSSRSFRPIRVRVTNKSQETIEGVDVRIVNKTALATLEDIDAVFSLGFWEASSGNAVQNTKLEPGADLTTIFLPQSPGDYEVVARGKATSGIIATAVRIGFAGESQDVELTLPGRFAGPVTCRSILPEGVAELKREDGVSISFRNAFNDTFTCPEMFPEFRKGPLQLRPGQYDTQSVWLPNRNWYVASARQGTRDVLAEGIQLTEDATDLELRIASGAATLQGKVINKGATPVHGAVIALMPEFAVPPGKVALALQYARSDQSGNFKIDGIIPGKYRVFAWRAVRRDSFAGSASDIDPQFASKYSAQATVVNIGVSATMAVDLHILDEP
jgi:hypothetical protein